MLVWLPAYDCVGFQINNNNKLVMSHQCIHVGYLHIFRRSCYVPKGGDLVAHFLQDHACLRAELG
jgi:hypothetical protein